jgi:hypothetical protein
LLVSKSSGNQEELKKYERTYTEIVPMKRIEYIHNLSDNNASNIDPVKIGMPSDFPQEQRHVVTFKDSGRAKTEVPVTEYRWPLGQMMEF